MNRTCTQCGCVLKTRHQIKFCSNKCQQQYQHESVIKEWKSSYEINPDKFRKKNISAHPRRYLFEKFQSKCSLCGWRKVHEISGVVPLEVNHIDGDADNNHENNLQLLCPNCHSLTPYFRNLNRGRGRKWRTERSNQISLPKS